MEPAILAGLRDAPHKNSGNSFRKFGLPPRPKGFTPKQFAIYLLRVGAEIEHSLAIQYLYAAYAIDETSEDAGNLPVLKWKTDLRLIAREEMAHLITVQNLLRALGEEPHLNRGPLHRDESKLPLPFKLEPLNELSLGKFVLVESPEPEQINDRDRAVVDQIRRRLGKKARILRVGSIYAALYWLFLKDNDPGPEWPFPMNAVPYFIRKYRPSDHTRAKREGYHVGDKDFVSDVEYVDMAASAKEWGVFENSTHVDGASPRDTALASLRWIMSQGEGPNAIEDSHFCRFLNTYHEFTKMGKKSAKFVITVPDNPRIKGAQGCGTPGAEVGTLISNRGTARWGALFNLRYQFMLLNILESLTSSRKTMAEKRRRLARWATVEMEFMKKIGQVLPRMDLRNRKKPHRAGRKREGPRAGAPFQGVFLPTTPKERKHLRRQILDDSGACISDLQDPRLVPSGYTEDSPTAAMIPGLLDAMSRQDDEMRQTLE
jgi:hypothetical protein